MFFFMNYLKLLKSKKRNFKFNYYKIKKYLKFKIIEEKEDY